MKLLPRAWLDRLAPRETEAGAALPVRLGGRGSFSASTAPAQVKGFDQPLVWVTVALLLWGLVMVYSASIAMPDNPKFTFYTHTHFVIRHAMSLMVAFVAALLQPNSAAC